MDSKFIYENNMLRMVIEALKKKKISSGSLGDITSMHEKQTNE